MTHGKLEWELETKGIKRSMNILSRENTIGIEGKMSALRVS